MERVLSQIKLVEVPTNSAGKQKFYLPEVPDLRGKKIILALSINDASPDDSYKAPSGKVIINTAAFGVVSLTLADTLEKINAIPGAYIAIAGKLPKFEIVPDFAKCYFNFASTSGIVTTESIFVVLGSGEFVDKTPIADFIENIQVAVNATTDTKHYFPDSDILRGKIVHNIKIAEVTMAPDGQTGITTTARYNSYLNLVDTQGKLVVENLPLIAISPSIDMENRINLADIEIDWTKSFVQVSDTSVNVLNSQYVFTVEASDKKKVAIDPKPGIQRPVKPAIKPISKPTIQAKRSIFNR